MQLHPSLRALGSTGLLVAAALTAASCSLVLGIGDPSLDPAGGTGGTGGSGGAAATTSEVASASSATSSGTGGGEVTYPCTPTDPVCTQVKSDCLAVVDNTGKTSFALRIGQLDFYKPDAFTGTIEKAAFLSSITMNLPECNLKGSGSFSWVVQFDRTAQTFQIGASKPPADPHDGYSFVNETITQGGQMFNVAPISGKATLAADGTITADTLETVLIPAYLTVNATDLLLIPLHKVHIISEKTRLSPDFNCVGSYNAAGLKASDDCLPDVNQNIGSFIPGGKIEGFISLEEADKIIISSFGLNRSLCVLLSGSAGTFGDGGSPARCKRDGFGKIKYNGDWCAATNTPADASCYDASTFSAGFAASAVKLN
jgi:hypothetical protein